MNNGETPDIEQTKQEVIGVFSRAAPIYDRIGPQFFSYFGHRLVELARLPSGAQVLDVATGKGAILFPAVEAVGPHGHVIGIDLSEAMVHETTEEIRRLKLDNVDVCRMDAEYLQFPDMSFDCVLCGFAIFFFPQLHRALSEMRRVLKPNGRIAVSTWDRLFDEKWKWFEDLVKAHLPPEAKTKQISESQSPPPALDTPEGLEGVMKIAGFNNTQVIAETTEIIYTSEQEWWSALWSHGIRESLEKVEKATGSDGLDRFRTTVLQRIQLMRQADGIHQLFPALFSLANKPQA